MNLINNWKYLFKFAFVGASGAIINVLVLWLLTEFGHLFYLLSALIAIEISILWNFGFNTKLTFKYKFKNKFILLDSIIKYHLASLVGLLINLSVLLSLTEFININYIISEAIAILLAFGINYILSINYIWHSKNNISK
jgi:dolichol-phosphate mannosyltransferase